jgi:hypothetical protein
MHVTQSSFFAWLDALSKPSVPAEMSLKRKYQMGAQEQGVVPLNMRENKRPFSSSVLQQVAAMTAPTPSDSEHHGASSQMPAPPLQQPPLLPQHQHPQHQHPQHHYPHSYLHSHSHPHPHPQAHQEFLLQNIEVERGGVLRLVCQQRISPVIITDSKGNTFSVIVYYNHAEGIMQTRELPSGVYTLGGSTFRIREPVIHEALHLAKDCSCVTHSGTHDCSDNEPAQFLCRSVQNAILYGIRTTGEAMGKRPASSLEVHQFAMKNIPSDIPSCVFDLVQDEFLGWASPSFTKICGTIDAVRDFYLQKVAVELLFKIVIKELPKYAQMQICMAQALSCLRVRAPNGKVFVFHDLVFCFEPWSSQTFMIGAYCKHVDVVGAEEHDGSKSFSSSSVRQSALF